jgi:hypothetical protein
MSNKLKKYIDRFDQLKDIKKHWEPQFQEIGENIFVRKQEFSSNLETLAATQGEFLNEDLFDNSAYDALEDFSSALLSDLWDKGARSVKINPTEDMLGPDGKMSKDLKQFFDRLNAEKNRVMDHNEAGLATALDEDMWDNCGFGTSSIVLVEDENDDTVPVRYEAWDVISMYIGEGKDGRVDTLHALTRSTVKNVVAEYGKNKVHEKVKKLYEEGKYSDTVDILKIIEPRNVYNPSKKGSKNKPVASVHIDYTHRHIMRESGFDEFPAVISRFAKRSNEVWGRCPSFLAIGTVRDINVLAESLIRAQEKSLDMPLGILDDGSLGRGSIDTSAGAINTIRYNSRLSSSNPVFPLFEIREMKSSYERLNDLTLKIAKHYKLDKLVDMEGTEKTHTNVPQTLIREGKMAKPLFKFYNRQEHEKFVPLVQKTINIIMKRGLVGVQEGSELEQRVFIDKGKDPIYLPDEILRRIENNEDFYDLQFLTPARRKRDIEEVQAMQTVAAGAVELASIDPSYADYFNFDEYQKLSIIKSGVPLTLMHDEDTVKAIRENRAKQMQAMSQLEMADKASDIRAKNAQTAFAQQRQRGRI